MIGSKNILMFLGLMNSLMAFGATNQEIFLRGTKAYQEGAYQEALDWYEQVTKKGDAVWHNMGNCCYHLNRFVDARINWQRAQQHAVYDDYCTLQTQLAVLDAQLGDEAPDAKQTWLFWIRSHTASYSLLMVQLMTLMLWFLFCIALKKRAHALALALLILSAVGIWLSIDMHTQRAGDYAVSIEEIPLYVGPNSSYHQQGVIPHAHTVRITDSRDGWYKIAYKELAGWVQADKLVTV